MSRSSRAAWRQDRADALLNAVRESLLLWPEGATDVAELAYDIALEACLIAQLDAATGHAAGVRMITGGRR